MPMATNTPLAHHRAAAPHLLITRVEDEVRIRLDERSRTPLRDVGVHLLRQRRHLAFAHLQAAEPEPHGQVFVRGVESASVIALTLRVDTPSTYICNRARTNAFSLRW